MKKITLKKFWEEIAPPMKLTNIEDDWRYFNDKDHFYLPNGNGLAGYPLSAYDNFRNHYNGAIANYNAGNYTEKTLLTIADDSASVARNNYNNANSLNEDKMHNATNVTLKRAQRDVAGVIYKFCKDTGIVS